MTSSCPVERAILSYTSQKPKSLYKLFQVGGPTTNNFIIKGQTLPILFEILKTDWYLFCFSGQKYILNSETNGITPHESLESLSLATHKCFHQEYDNYVLIIAQEEFSCHTWKITHQYIFE